MKKKVIKRSSEIPDNAFDLKRLDGVKSTEEVRIMMLEGNPIIFLEVVWSVWPNAKRSAV
jgi:hypothetical protein